MIRLIHHRHHRAPGIEEGNPVRDGQRLESVWNWLKPGLSFEYSAFRQILGD